MSKNPLRGFEVETLVIFGIQHRILVGASENPSGYEVVELSGPVGLGIPPHIHSNEDETYYVARGAAEFMEDGAVVRAEAGMAVNLSRGKPHAWTLLEPDTILLLTIVPGRLTGMFRQLAALPPGPPDPAAIGRITGEFGIEMLPPPPAG